MAEVQPNRAYRDITTIEILLLAAVGFPFYLLFDWQGQAFRGLVAGMSVACVGALVSILWPLVRKPRFWIGLAIVALIHALLVYFLPYKGDFRFGYAFFPFFFLDWYVSARFVVFMCHAKLT